MHGHVKEPEIFKRQLKALIQMKLKMSEMYN